MNTYLIQTYARWNWSGRLIVEAWSTLREHPVGEHIELKLCAENRKAAIVQARAARRLMEERKAETKTCPK